MKRLAYPNPLLGRCVEEEFLCLLLHADKQEEPP